jgi:endonuclease YncB( thermonuclease family)
MRRFILILILAVIFAAGIFAGRLFFQRSNSPEISLLVSTGQSANSFVAKNGSTSLATSATDSGETVFVASGTVRVARVIDGDTIVIDGGERVRYIGMDTPEIVDPRKPVQCFGRESAARNRELVEGKMVRLVRDVSDRDKYHRLLRYVYLANTSTSLGASGVFINLELVKEGYATAFAYPPDILHAKDFVAAEKSARDAKLGLWSVCKGG